MDLRRNALYFLRMKNWSKTRVFLGFSLVAVTGVAQASLETLPPPRVTCSAFPSTMEAELRRLGDGQEVVYEGGAGDGYVSVQFTPCKIVDDQIRCSGQWSNGRAASLVIYQGQDGSSYKGGLVDARGHRVQMQCLIGHRAGT
jgi:hypothetical protein